MSDRPYGASSVRAGAGTWKSENGRVELEDIGGGELRMVGLGGGTATVFESSTGQVKRVIDRQGRETTYSYNAGNRALTLRVIERWQSEAWPLLVTTSVPLRDVARSLGSTVPLLLAQGTVFVADPPEPGLIEQLTAEPEEAWE